MSGWRCTLLLGWGRGEEVGVYDVRLMVYFAAGVGPWGGGRCVWCQVDGVLCCWGGAVGGGRCVWCQVEGVLCCWGGAMGRRWVCMMSGWWCTLLLGWGRGEEVGVYDVRLMVYFAAGVGPWGGGRCVWCQVEGVLCCWGGAVGGGGCVWCQVGDDVLCYRGGVCTARPSGRRWECMRTVTLCEYWLTFLWKSLLTTVWPFWKIGCCIQFVSCLELGGSAKAWWDLLCAAVFQHNYTF